MIIDNHVHTGWFKGSYYSSEYVWNEIQSIGIDKFVLAPLSAVIRTFHRNAIREVKTIQRLSKGCCIPLLWVAPFMFKPEGEYVLRELLHSGIAWKGMKIHYYMHPEWDHNKKLAAKAFELARRYNLPVLTHTGGSPECEAGVFKQIAQNYPDLTIVLAHGRPIEETLDVLGCCPKTMVDTAFMPQDDQKLLVDSGFADRMLFGTDVPINKYYYPNMSTAKFVCNHIETLRSVTTSEQFEAIMSRTPYL